MLLRCGLYSANIVLIVSNLLIVQSIICCKNQKHFNQFPMSLLFCVILFYKFVAGELSLDVCSSDLSCFVRDYILQILFSSYLISLSFNQLFAAKIRSISISSPCHFYFVLYCFIDFSYPCICPYQSS